MRLYYTEKEQKQILKSIVILIDTREQENAHILQFLERKKVKIKKKKLDFGDYSFFIPANPELGIKRDIWFDKEIVVERKGSLTELATNIGKKREQFENELIRKKDAKMFLLIENGSWANINMHMYRSDYKPVSFLGTLYAFMARYGISIDFTSEELAGQFIYSTFYYYLREKILNMEPDTEEGA